MAGCHPRLAPPATTLEAVHEHVSARAPLTTELYVIGCEYVPVGIGIAYELRSGYEPDETTRAVQTAVRTLLWPLPPGGPFEQATGWPLARAVRDREIEVAVSRVPGVDEVIDIRLFDRRRTGEWERVQPGTDGAAQIVMEDYQLPEVERLVVLIDGPLDDTLDTEASGDGGVGVPVVPELC